MSPAQSPVWGLYGHAGRAALDGCAGGVFAADNLYPGISLSGEIIIEYLRDHSTGFQIYGRLNYSAKQAAVLGQEQGLEVGQFQKPPHNNDVA